MRKFLLLVGVFSIAALSRPVFGDNNGAALKIGTLGFGVEVSKSMPLNFSGRLGVNGFSYDHDDSYSGIEYDAELKLASVSALVDWRPFGNVFRVAAGALYNGNEIKANNQQSGSYNIGNATFTAAEVGNLVGKVEFDKIAPYLGLGLNVPVAPTFAMTFDFGVVLQGSPKASLTSDGNLSGDPFFQAELARELDEFQQDLDDFEYYPVLAVGFRKNF